MSTVTTFAIFSVLVASTLAQNCTNQDVFKNVKVLKFSGDDSDGEVRAKSTDDLKDAYRIEVLHQDVPKLCEGAIVDFPELDKLVLQDDRITEIQPGAFKNVPVLRELKIAYNEIKTIKTGVFNYLNVKFLNLQHNGINLIETSAFDDMPELQVLELDFNEIKEIDPHWFSGSPKVRRLTMAENQLRDLPEAAFQNMANNNVDIWIMNNKITTVDPKAFQGIQKANHLWFYDNKIAELDDDLFANVDRIEHLSFGGNQLKCVSDKFLGNLRVKSVNFDGNPLNCDCITKLKTWASENNVENRLVISKLQCTIERARKVLAETADV